MSQDVPPYELAAHIRGNLKDIRESSGQIDAHEATLISIYRALNQRDREVLDRVALSLASNSALRP